METTHVELFGLIVTEPFTWLTNWLVAGFSFYFGHKLFHRPGADRQARYWSVFFLFMGIASLTGGTAHGFIHYVGQNFHYAAWIFTGVAVYGAQLAALEIIRDSRWHQPLRIVITLELILMTLSVLMFRHFDSVRVNSALGLIGLVLPLQLYAYKAKGWQRNGLIALGIVSNVVPALIHAMRFSYNKWFNFNDLSHVVMLVCFYLIYLGAGRSSRTGDAPEAGSLAQT